MRATGRGSADDSDEPQERKFTEPEPLVKQQPWEPKPLDEEQTRNNPQVIPIQGRPDVIFRLSDAKTLLLDGLLDKPSSIAEHAVVVNAHLGQGNVRRDRWNLRSGVQRPPQLSAPRARIRARGQTVTRQSGSAGSGDALPRQPSLGAGSGTIEREYGTGDERRKGCFLWLYASRLPVDRPDAFPHHPPNMGLDLGRPRHSGNHSGKAWCSGCRSAESQFCSLLRSKSRITIGSRTVARSIRPIFYSKSAREIGQTPDPRSTLSDRPSSAVR
jgi:hypothetical protein